MKRRTFFGAIAGLFCLSWMPQKKEPPKIMIGKLHKILGMKQTATLSVYSFSSTGAEDTGIDITVYNLVPQKATTDRWTVVGRHAFTGKWIITHVECE